MKCHFHSAYCRNAPADNAPSNAPNGGVAEKVANVAFLAFPGGIIIVSVATELGMIMPPAIPVRARITTKET